MKRNQIRASSRIFLGVLGALCVPISLTTSGCGYSLAGRGSFLPAYIQSIGIPTFANRTTVFNLETLLTQKVRSEFIGRGKYRILPEATGVDAVLTGEVVSASPAPASFTSTQIASRYVITMIARVELRDLKDNKVLWENPGLTFRQDYEAQSAPNTLEPSAFFEQDRDALERMSTDFARTIVSAILEAF
jgi:hypothetical protein